MSPIELRLQRLRLAVAAVLADFHYFSQEDDYDGIQTTLLRLQTAFLESEANTKVDGPIGPAAPDSSSAEPSDHTVGNGVDDRSGSLRGGGQARPSRRPLNR